VTAHRSFSFSAQPAILVAKGFLWQASGMDKLIPPLVVAALGALTFLAYKHYAAFMIVNYALNFVIVITILGMGCWNSGADKAHSKLIKFLKTETWKESDEAINSIKAPMTWIVVALGLSLYLTFLSYLPKLLAE